MCKTGKTLAADEQACPCWPRLLMGWNWSVYWAVVLAGETFSTPESFFSANAGSISLNITNRGGGWLKSESNFSGCYIDNIFNIGEEEREVYEAQTKITWAVEKRGFILSENNTAREKRKLLGIEFWSGIISPPPIPGNRLGCEPKKGKRLGFQ